MELFQGATAPFLRLLLESGTMRSGSKNREVPSPSQDGQAPAGALKEKSRGSISSIVNQVYNPERIESIKQLKKSKGFTTIKIDYEKRVSAVLYFDYKLLLCIIYIYIHILLF